MIEIVNEAIVEVLQEEILTMQRKIILKIPLFQKNQRINQNLKAKRIIHNEIIVF